MKKHYYTYNDVHNAALDLHLKMYKDGWRPDYIVGINRGGLPLALRLSHLLDVRMYTLDVCLRDGGDVGPESNCWMSEDAFGSEYVEDRDAVWGKTVTKPELRKNILIVDDINDTGATFKWIVQDWQSSCLPNDPAWDEIWGNNVRFAAMTENLSSEFGEVSYSWHEVNKAEDDVWLVYPWEVGGKE